MGRTLGLDEGADSRRSYAPRPHEAHRHPDLRPRLQHGSHRAGAAPSSWPARVVAVIANRPTPPGWPSRGAWHRHGRGRPQGTGLARGLRRRAGAAIDGFEPDLVVLAGFMRILGPASCALRGPPAQHPPVAAAGLPGPAHAPPCARGRLQAGGRHGALRDAELDHGPIVMQAGAGAARRRRGDAGRARAGHRTRDLPAGRALVRRRQAAPASRAACGSSTVPRNR
jgi:folate-dependent phosphoribosylglycinamide formyltransferase PurN